MNLYHDKNIRGQTFFLARGFICASSAVGTVFLADFVSVPPGLALADGAPAASSDTEDGGGTADSAAALAAALDGRTVAVGSGYQLDAMFPATAALSLADFFPVPLGLDNGGLQQMHEQWVRPLKQQQQQREMQLR